MAPPDGRLQSEAEVPNAHRNGTFNGRITLPTHVRRQLGLKIGDSVDFVEIEKGRFAITPVQLNHGP